MYKIAAINLSTNFLVKLILGLVMIMVLASFFTKGFIPFLEKQPFLGKILILLALGFFLQNVAWILAKIGID